MTIGERLREAAASLEPVTDTPRLDAEILLAHALGFSRAKLLAEQRESFDSPHFDALLARRLNHEPIAYILGEWDFFSMTLEVRAPLLVPRPETEHLVERALEHMRDRALAQPRVLDLCTGTGCVACAIAQHGRGAQVTATDVHPVALEVTARNARRHDLDVDVVESDLFSALDGERFDVIVSNPPYVPEAEWETLSPVITRHEDRGALLSGADGLDTIRRIVSEAPRYLEAGGLLALECGEDQAGAIGVLMREAGFNGVGTVRDLGGHERIVFGTRP